jgi:hypothetical protein
MATRTACAAAASVDTPAMPTLSLNSQYPASWPAVAARASMSGSPLPTMHSAGICVRVAPPSNSCSAMPRLRATRSCAAMSSADLAAVLAKIA